MREDTAGSEPHPDAYYLEDGSTAGSTPHRPVPPTVTLLPPEPADEQPRDPEVTPRGREREETRARTAELVARLGTADAQERTRIRDEVVTLHLWLATSAARRFGYRGEYDDLLQVARGGLVEAFDRYDPAQTSYAYFAWVTMNGLLRRHLRDHGWSVRPPRAVQESANVLRQMGPELAQELGRTPSTSDLATHLGWTVTEVRAARTAELGLHTTSLDALAGESWVTAQQGEWNRVETHVVLGGALVQLTDEERRLLRLRFDQELTQSQIGEILGVTQMQVSRLLTRLMAKLRRMIGELDGPTRDPAEV